MNECNLWPCILYKYWGLWATYREVTRQNYANKKKCIEIIIIYTHIIFDYPLSEMLGTRSVWDFGYFQILKHLYIHKKTKYIENMSTKHNVFILCIYLIYIAKSNFILRFYSIWLWQLTIDQLRMFDWWQDVRAQKPRDFGAFWFWGLRMFTLCECIELFLLECKNSK